MAAFASENRQGHCPDRATMVPRPRQELLSPLGPHTPRAPHQATSLRPFLGLSAGWASPEGAGKPFLPGQLPEEAEALAVCQFRMRQREDTKGFGGRAVTFESPCA